MEEELKKRFDEIERMIMHVHGDVESLISKTNEIERKISMCNNGLLYQHMKESFDKLASEEEHYMNCDMHDLISMVETYTPINEQDNEAYEKRVKDINKRQLPE